MASPRKGRPKGKAGSQRAGTSNVVAVRMPKAYLEILTSEAQRLGLKRGVFLTLLLRRKRGEVQLERSPGLKAYTFSDRELAERKLWIWYLSPEVREQVRRDQLRMGLHSVGSWVTQMLNQWIGCPQGLECVGT